MVPNAFKNSRRECNKCMDWNSTLMLPCGHRPIVTSWYSILYLSMTLAVREKL
jgi:hypothetical protein